MKKIIMAALLTSVVGVAVWLFIKSYQRLDEKHQVAKHTLHLPTPQLRALDSTTFILNGQEKHQSTVIFYFDPHCEHCQNEANELKKQATAFENVTLLWLSTERLWVLREFEQKYGLQKQFSSLKIAQISPQDADKQFGFRTVPTILIYDAKGNLAKKYVGETKIEAILKHLH